MALTRAFKTGVSIKRKNAQRVIVQTQNATYETKRNNFNKNKLKREPIAELQNPEVVYMLGGSPTYIHSTEAYFRAGVKTAEIEMNKMLATLMTKQQSIMIERANYIDCRWKEALDALGIEGDSKNAFKKFNILWTQKLNNSSASQEYLTALVELNKLKQATTLINEAEKNISEIRESLNKESGSGQEKAESFNRQLNDRLDNLGLNITVSFNDKTQQYSYGGEQWQKLKDTAKEAAKNAINYALKNSSSKTHMVALIKSMYNHIHNKLVTSDGNTSISGIIDYLDSKDIGNLFDFFDANIVFNDKAIDELANQFGGFMLQAIAPEKKLNDDDKKRSTITDKNDALIKLLSSGIEHEVVFNIPVSNKTGSIIQRYANNADSKTLNFIDRFTASISSAHLDFSNIESTAQVSKEQQEKLTQLFNYVLRNDAAFAGQQGFVQPFKEMIACYIGWLKIVTEIIGNPDNPLDYAMAIRTPNNLYNTADIMRKFINLNNPLDIIRGNHYMNVTELKKHFYKRGLTAESKDGKNITGDVGAGMASYLYTKKRDIIEQLVAKNKRVTYYNLYNSDLKLVLQNLAANTLKLPALKTWFQINLENVTSILNI